MVQLGEPLTGGQGLSTCQEQLCDSSVGLVNWVTLSSIPVKNTGARIMSNKLAAKPGAEQDLYSLYMSLHTTLTADDQTAPMLTPSWPN